MRSGYDARPLNKDAPPILAQLYSEFEKKFDHERTPQFHKFVERLYASVSEEQLSHWNYEALCSSTLKLWSLFQSRSGEEINLQIYNPPCSEANKAYTAIEVVMPDMPFIVDSLRIELDRSNLRVEQLHNLVLGVERDAEGGMKSFVLPDDEGLAPQMLTGSVGPAEALLQFKVDLISSEETIDTLEKDLRLILQELKVIVSDFKQIVDTAQEARDEMHALVRSERIDDSDKMFQETADFLDWLVADHFIFLGMKEYRFEYAQGEHGREKSDEENRETQDDSRPIQGCFVPLENASLGILRVEHEHDILEQLNCVLAVSEQPLEFAKSAVKSRHHRPAYPDIVMVRRFDAEGRLIGERRFIGLYTSRVYNASCRKIPYVCRKFKQVVDRSQFPENGHDAKALLQILETYPREELFQSSVEELYQTAVRIVLNQYRPELQLFMRSDPYGRFISALIYVPRDAFNTQVRLKFQSILAQAVEAQELDYSTLISESLLARLHLTLRLDPHKSVSYNLVEIRLRLMEASQTWHDALEIAARSRLPSPQARRLLSKYGIAFPAAYQEDFRASTAIADIDYLERLCDEKSLEINIYRLADDPSNELRIKLYYCSRLQTLSDILPILENLGFYVLSAAPYTLRFGGVDELASCAQGPQEYYINDYRVRYCRDVSGHVEGDALDLLKTADLKENLCDAFSAIWRGELDNDPMNRLVLAANLSWQQVGLLRAYSHYLTQIKFGFSQSYIQETLLKNAKITLQLVELFAHLFDPMHSTRLPQACGEQKNLAEKVSSIKSAIDQVSNLDEDRILSHYLSVILATLRTNFYKTEDPHAGESICFKLSPAAIPNIPKPILQYEIFVFSPKIEGVHLRGGKVARGGLRWSDRREDYRIEILGLVKAQQVKNAVIVPVGAKGGFVLKQLTSGMSCEEAFEHGRACYRIFIRGLLSVTDNLVDGEVVPPKQVVRRDEDDPYLVVAADKGTATFSDTANEEAAAINFWVGDGFAAGGSEGYDHKKMGITARGAWVSVQRHFRELGRNVQEEPVTVIGIGDMAGDVFGNGMLQSQTIELVAAFNHQHIFIDPKPDAQQSFNERQRLFALPRSSWGDYDKQLISSGGGIFSRSAKQIKISTEMQARFQITDMSMTPDELIKALLKAPADLLWNGGIGTYVKSSAESNAEVGDKANDDLRIDGSELRVRVVGEGGNLGLTQLGRIEYSQKGGLCNTDFIDNVGGVACSDHEVNIKILLNAEVAAGRMTLEQRNKLQLEMTEQVASFVLQSTYSQVQAISLVARQVGKRMEEYRRFIHHLEDLGRMDRTLEAIPNDDEMVARKNAGAGLTRPELSVLMAYSKALLKEQLLSARFSDDSSVVKEIEATLPSRIAEGFHGALYNHKLRAELIATSVANAMINQMGITFVKRMEDASGADPIDIAKAWLAVEAIFEIKPLWREIEALDHKVAADVQMEMMLELVRLVRGATRWLLRNFRSESDMSNHVKNFKPGVVAIKNGMNTLLSGVRKESRDSVMSRYLEAGVPKALAEQVANAANLRLVLSMIQASDQVNASLESAVEHYFALGESLQLYWLSEEIEKLTVDSHWQALAREALRDDLEWQQRALMEGVLQMEMGDGVSEQVVEDGEGSAIVANGGSENQSRMRQWLAKQQHMVERWNALLEEIKATKGRDYPQFAVALRELMDLAQSTRHG